MSHVLCHLPSDFRSWESSQTLLTPSTGQFEKVKQFPNLKLAFRGPTNYKSSVLSSTEGKSATFSLLSKLQQGVSQHINIEMSWQSFALKKTAIGRDTLLEIPRNHLEELTAPYETMQML